MNASNVTNFTVATEYDLTDSAVDILHSVSRVSGGITVEEMVMVVKPLIYVSSIVFYLVLAFVATTDNLVRHLVYINFIFFNAHVRDISCFARMADGIKNLKPLGRIFETLTGVKMYMCALLLISRLEILAFGEQDMKRKIRILGHCVFTHFIFHGYFIYDDGSLYQDIVVHTVATYLLPATLICFIVLNRQVSLLEKLRLVFVDIVRHYGSVYVFLTIINYGLFKFHQQ